MLPKDGLGDFRMCLEGLGCSDTDQILDALCQDINGPKLRKINAITAISLARGYTAEKLMYAYQLAKIF